MRALRVLFIFISFLFTTGSVLGQAVKTGEIKHQLSTVHSDEEKLQSLLDQTVAMLNISLDSAILLAFEAEELAEKIGDLYANATALKYIGTVHYYKDEWVEAIRNWEASLSIFQESGDKEGIAKILGNLGAIYNYQGYDSRALKYSLDSYELSKEIADTSTIISALNNIGLIHSKNKATEDLALENYKKALEFSQLTNNQEGIGTQSQNIGEIYYNRGNKKQALEYFLKALNAYKSINSNNITNPLNFLGKVYMDFKDYDRAILTLEEAYETSLKLESKLNMSRSLNSLAETYIIIGNYGKAIDLFEQSVFYAAEIGAVSEELIAVRGLARAHEAISDNINANRYLKRALALNDTIDLMRNQEQINNLRVQLEINDIIEDANRKAELKDVQLRQQKIVMFFLLLGIVSISFFLGILYRLSKQRQKANKVLEEQNILITGQKKEITDSIRYASRIQNAVLTPADDISKFLPDHFILYRPRDIVSGDFYWITQIKGRIMCIVADSTGHGVPGAFMSMLGIAFLNEIISRDPDMPANELLNELRDHIILSLRQRGRAGDSQDGMDLAAMIIDPEKKIIEYAGANNPLLLYREGELIEFKPDKMPIGFHARADQSFTNHVIDIKKGDVAYAFSDGFPDQFGGPKGKKFMVKNLKKQLLCLHQKPMLEQKKELEKILDKWMSNIDQIDDILLMGIRF